MRVKGRTYFLLLVIVATAVVIVASLGMKYWQSKLLPLVVGSVVFGLGLIELWRELHLKEKPAGVNEEREQAVSGDAGQLAIAIAWVVGAAFTCYLVGLLVGVTLFILSFLKAKGRTWRVAAMVAVITGACIYFIFEVALGTGEPLYRGVIYQMILSD